MKPKNLVYLLILIIMSTSYSHNGSSNPENWSKEELAKWFKNNEWKSGWKIIADESVNQEEMAKQFFQNPERWQKAFAFLKTEDLSSLATGRYELEGSDLFAIIDEYITKDEEVARFEAHRKYADIQYVVSGKERIGITSLEKTTVTIPFDEDKDIVFLDASAFEYRAASPERFFVFFPEDAHCPGVKMMKNSRVRKVVVKVRIE
jgi:YhcH/YjgK/YiaL family protein